MKNVDCNCVFRTNNTYLQSYISLPLNASNGLVMELAKVHADTHTHAHALFVQYTFMYCEENTYKVHYRETWKECAPQCSTQNFQRLSLKPVRKLTCQMCIKGNSAKAQNVLGKGNKIRISTA